MRNGDLEDPQNNSNISSTEQGDGPSESLSEIPLERNTDAGVSLPSPEEVRMDAGVTSSSRSLRQGSGRLNTWFCYSIFFFVLLVCIIGLGVGLSNRNDRRSASNLQDGNVRKVSVESLALYLEQNGVTSSATIFDYETAQAQAAQWLANADARNLALPSVGVTNKEGYHYMTRYVLATLYFAFQGEEWRFPFNFLSSDDLCNWRGVLQRGNEVVPYGAICDLTGVLRALYLGTSTIMSLTQL